MDYKYIEQLLSRYFDCATTPSEERMLRAFFSGDDVPTHLARYKAFFDVLGSEASRHVSPGFHKRLLDKAGVSETVAAKPVRFRLVGALRPLYNAVATVAIVLLVGHAAQRAFSHEDAAIGVQASSITSAETDGAAAPVLETLRAVGDGQKTAVADSTSATNVHTSEKAQPHN